MWSRNKSISCKNCKENKFEQIDLFTDYTEVERKNEKEKKERNLQRSILDIKKKYGKNAILKAMNFEDGGTTKNEFISKICTICTLFSSYRLWRTSILIIKEILGHKSICSTVIYIYVANKRLKEIMQNFNVLDLGGNKNEW